MTLASKRACVGLAALAMACASPAYAWHIRAGADARTFIATPQGLRGSAPHPMPMQHRAASVHPAGGASPGPQPAPHPPSPHPAPHPPRPGPQPAPHPPGPPGPPPPHHPDDWYSHWGAAAIVGATTVTAIAIGTAVSSVPQTCVPELINGVSYQQCGSTWYQPKYIGTVLQYVVVGPPR